MRRGLLALYQVFVTSCSSTGGCRTSSSRRRALGCSQSDGTHAQPRVKTVVSLAAFYRCCETTRMHSTILFIYLFYLLFLFFFGTSNDYICLHDTTEPQSRRCDSLNIPQSLECFTFIQDQIKRGGRSFFVPIQLFHLFLLLKKKTTQKTQCLRLFYTLLPFVTGSIFAHGGCYSNLG